MNRHVFVTARPQPIPRWLEAFPDAVVIRDMGKIGANLAPLTGATLVWLHVTGDDLSLADSLNAIQATVTDVPIVVLSNVPEDEQGLAALAAGASGYCSALTLPTVLQQVASVIENGGLWVGPRLMRRLMAGLADRPAKTQENTLELLSQRERQVAEAVARGSTNKEIARVMGITERTVKAHLSASFEKLDVRDRMQLSLLVNGVEDSTPIPQKMRA